MFDWNWWIAVKPVFFVSPTLEWLITTCHHLYCPFSFSLPFFVGSITKNMGDSMIKQQQTFFYDFLNGNSFDMNLTLLFVSYIKQ